VLVRQSNTLNTVGLRSFSGVANNAYTVAVTGILTGPIGTLLFDSTPFVYSESLTPPNPTKFRGAIHALSEFNNNFTIDVETATTFDYLPLVQPKTVVAYSEIPAGNVRFTVFNTSGLVYVNSDNVSLIWSDVVPSNLVYDLFIFGDDTTVTPVQISAVTYAPYVDLASGCTLVDGAFVLPDSTPFVFPTFAPCPVISGASATTVFGLLAVLCVCVCLLF